MVFLNPVFIPSPETHLQAIGNLKFLNWLHLNLAKSSINCHFKLKNKNNS